jgi:polygalacturonase
MRNHAVSFRGWLRNGFLWVTALIVLLGIVAFAGARGDDDPGLPHPTEGTFNVKEFGAVGDGKALDTAAISNAIRAANAAGGGKVVFPAGVYLSGTFELLSNVTLDLQANSVILGSPRLADYGAISQFGFAHVYGENSTGEGSLVGIIVARNAENTAIVGQGAIDGNADVFFDFQKPHVKP